MDIKDLEEMSSEDKPKPMKIMKRKKKHRRAGSPEDRQGLRRSDGELRPSGMPGKGSRPSPG